MEIFSMIMGIAVVTALFYGAALLVMDKEKEYRKRNYERNDSSRNI